MRVLVACEFSGIVRDAFTVRGHDAWSCDLLPTEKPGNHIQDDVLKHLDQGWDLMIAHPPCTHLAVSGAKHFREKIADGRQQKAVEFFMSLIGARIEKIAVENPIGIMSRIYRKPDQVIHPYYFGDSVQKSTCLWLKLLPKLIHISEPDLFGQPTHVDRGMVYVDPRGHKHGGVFTMRAKRAYSPLMLLPRTEERWKIRSRTFPGIAKAMAEQWG